MTVATMGGYKSFSTTERAAVPSLRIRSDCAHLGRQRKCCESLWICRETPGMNCVLSGAPTAEVRSCEHCPHWKPAQPIAPVRGQNFRDRPWEGAWLRKPWDYSVTVAIPVCDASGAVEAIVGLLRLQTERPFIMLIDTGSTADELQALQKLAGEDIEVHSLRLNGVRHPSDFPAVAMDLAFSACRTDYLLATHADCFLTGREVVEELMQLCIAQSPVVGYEITPRSHSDWHGMVGHTLTMFHVRTMDSINASWSLRRLIANEKHPDGRAASHDISPATSPNWPDTELLINYQCRKAGIVPLIIGTEANAARTTDHRIDHCRSWASAHLYGSQSAYATKSNNWLQDGIEKARARAGEWRMH